MQYPHVRAFFDQQTATWSYVVWSDGSELCAIIDSVLNYNAGACSTSTTTCDAIIDFVQSNKLQVQWILETHIHADHITGASYLKEKLGGAIAMSKHILAITATWAPLFNRDDIPLDGSAFEHLFEDNETFSIGNLTAKIIHTPGHTPADTTYIIGDSAFVGDTIFLPDVGSGRCDFPGGSAADSYQSSRTLFALPDAPRIYVGHDYPPALQRTPQCLTTVLDQKTANIRLRLGITAEEFIAARTQDDTGKEVPPLLLPSIQANLRAGDFGASAQGKQYITLPLNALG